MFYRGKENVVKVEEDFSGVQRTTWERKRLDRWKEQDHGGGEMQSQVVLLEFVRKASAFSPKIILLSTTLDFYYLLFVHGKKTLHHVSRQKLKNIGKKALIQICGTVLWRAEERIRMTNFHVASWFTSKNVPSFTAHMYSEMDWCFTVLLGYSFVYVLHIFKIRSYKQLTCDTRDALCHC